MTKKTQQYLYDMGIDIFWFKPKPFLITKLNNDNLLKMVAKNVHYMNQELILFLVMVIAKQTL